MCFPREYFGNARRAEPALASSHARTCPALNAVKVSCTERRMDCLNDFGFRHCFTAADNLTVQRIFLNKLKLLLCICGAECLDPSSFINKVCPFFRIKSRLLQQFRNILARCRSSRKSRRADTSDVEKSFDSSVFFDDKIVHRFIGVPVFISCICYCTYARERVNNIAARDIRNRERSFLQYFILRSRGCSLVFILFRALIVSARPDKDVAVDCLRHKNAFTEFCGSLKQHVIDKRPAFAVKRSEERR